MCVVIYTVWRKIRLIGENIVGFITNITKKTERIAKAGRRASKINIPACAATSREYVTCDKGLNTKDLSL